MLDQAKAAGQEGKIPVFYTAVFDKAGVYAAPLTPDVDAKALAAQDLAGKTDERPRDRAPLTIADRAFGFAAAANPRRSRPTRASSSCAATTCDALRAFASSLPGRTCGCPGPSRAQPASDEHAAGSLLGLDAVGRARPDDRRGRRRREPRDGDQRAREDQAPRAAQAHGQLSCSARRRMSRVASSSFCSAAIAVEVCWSPERSSCM